MNGFDFYETTDTSFAWTWHDTANELFKQLSLILCANLTDEVFLKVNFPDIVYHINAFNWSLCLWVTGSISFFTTYWNAWPGWEAMKAFKCLVWILFIFCDCLFLGHLKYCELVNRNLFINIFVKKKQHFHCEPLHDI